MIVYKYDSAAILAEPLKNRSERELLRAYAKLHQHLTDRALRPQLQKLDNECSTALKQFMRTKNVDFQLVPPYDHRQNAAERAIGIWKDHFVSGLASLDPNFPMHLWCRLVDQCTQTLNLMRPSRINPRLSAEAQLNGTFDYNKTLLAPPGTKVLIHETPNRRRTWAVHGVDGWYLGGARDHYRCYRVYATKTRAERIARTVEFFPHYGEMPKPSSADAAIRVAIDLCWALRHPTPTSPIAAIGDAQMDALHQLADIFAVATEPANTRATAPPRVKPLPHPTAPPKPGPLLPMAPAALPRVATLSTPPERGHTCHSPGPLRYPLSSGTTYTQPAPPPSTVRRSPRFQGLDAPHLVPPDATALAVLRLSNSEAPIVYPTARAHAVVHEATGQALNYRALSEGPDSTLWSHSMSNDLGQLAQGVGKSRPAHQRIPGTNTIFFIKRRDVPPGRKVTYCKQEATIRPNKTETHRVRKCAGGDRLDFPGPTATQTASLTTIKILLNSTISTPGARFSAFDIKNFYYGTPMNRYEYMKLHISKIPTEIIDEHSLASLATDDG
jgi:hypothetical protein